MGKDLKVEPGKLSDIMPTEARIALPEIVSVFICKYETELYNTKAALSETIIELKKEKELIAATALDSADFSAFIDIKINKLCLISYQASDAVVNWDDKTITATIGLHNLDSKGNELNYSGRNTGFEKEFSTKLATSYSKAYAKVNTDLAETNLQLQDAVAKLNDMPRKGRQVTARISEMRLEEQGLSAFLNDEVMQKLISTS